MRRLRPFAGILSIDAEAAVGDSCTHEGRDARGLESVVSHMTTTRTFRTVLVFVLLWSSIPLVVKAQTACFNCYNAFQCPQNTKSVPIPVKYIRLETIAE